MMRREEDPHARVLHEISTMISQLLHSPTPIPIPTTQFPNDVASTSTRPSRNSTISSSPYHNYYWPWPWPSPTTSFSPASFASLFLGLSLALMMFGLIIFLIGFILMPWVIGLVLIFYFAGFIENLSLFFRSFFSWAFSSRHVDYPGWKYS